MKTNSLIYRTIRHTAKETFEIKIRLNDDCKNGHQDFAITGTIYEKGKPKTDRYMISGGAIGDEIAANFPEFEIFERLHLCDWQGIPMYAVENGFYHLKNGFNSKSTGEEFKFEFCKYYRITPEQFDTISKSENKIEYAILLQELGILAQWKKEAGKAIKQLEELTGDEFLCDSVKSQFNAPELQQIEDFKTKKAAGYYSDEKKAERAEISRNEARAKRFSDIEKHCAEEIKKETIERDIKLFVLRKIDSLTGKRGFSLDFNFDDFIYYNHTNRVKFNWRKSAYSKEMKSEDFKMFCDSIGQADFDKLPGNISFECNGVVYEMNKS